MLASRVTLANLRRGTGALFAYGGKKGQPGRGQFDFDNDLYRTLEQKRQHGITEEFWRFLVDRLWEWRAIRSSRPGINKKKIADEGINRLPELKRCYNRLSGRKTSTLPSIEALEWDDVSPLFDVASAIKGSSTPMFGSKLCHFLSPSAYFVFDGTLIKRGWKEHRDYWSDCRAEWLKLKQPGKEVLKRELRREMPRTCSPCASYPWPTKITELCQWRS